MVSPGLDQGVHHRGVGLRAGVRLDVGELGAEQGLDPVDRELLDHVNVLAAAVVALARVALGVLVGQHRTLRLHHSPGGVVLRGDHLQAVTLAGQLGVDLRGDLRIQRGQVRVQARGNDLLERRAGARGRGALTVRRRSWTRTPAAESSGPSSVDGDLEQPAGTVRIAVDQRRVIDDGVVDLGDLAGDRRVQVRDGLGRLDLAAGLPRGHRGADLGQVHVDDVAQGVGGDGGDADGHNVPGLRGNPLVLGGVLQFSGNFCHVFVP